MNTGNITHEEIKYSYHARLWPSELSKVLAQHAGEGGALRTPDDRAGVGARGKEYSVQSLPYS